MLETIKIDSLKLRIPRYKVEYVDSTFAQEYQKVFTKSGEIEDKINLDKHKVDVTNGITTRIAVFHSLQGGMAEEQIVIQCNAKQLKQSYFLGINKNTIHDLYNYINDLEIIRVSFDDFMDAYVSDIDFCYDVKVDPNTMIEANQEIYNKVKPNYFKYVGKPYRQKTNVGLQFNSRERATPSKPYVKIYHKTLELDYKSFEFSQEYLKEVDYSDIGRLEFTIKNTRHRKKLNLIYHNLRDLLRLNHAEIGIAMFSGVLNYVETSQIIREHKDLSPTDRLILHFIKRTIQKGDDKQCVFESLNIFEQPQERSRMKKKLKQLIYQVNEKEQLVANQKTMNFLRKLRLNL